MSFGKKTIRDINLEGKRVLLRADYNVPVDAKGNIVARTFGEQSELGQSASATVRQAIASAPGLGKGHGPLNHFPKNLY